MQQLIDKEVNQLYTYAKHITNKEAWQFMLHAKDTQTFIRQDGGWCCVGAGIIKSIEVQGRTMILTGHETKWNKYNKFEKNKLHIRKLWKHDNYIIEEYTGNCPHVLKFFNVVSPTVAIENAIRKQIGL